MPSVSSTSLFRQFVSAPPRCLRGSTSLQSWSCNAPRYSTSSRAAFCSRRSTPASIPQGSSHLSFPRNTRRTFASTSSTRAAIAQRPPSHRTQLVSYPSPSQAREEDEDEDEPNVELVPPEEAVLEMTDRAAEQLRSIARRDHNDAAALRVAVESGGCHGYQYKMELAKKREPDDYHFTHPQIQPSNIYVDAVSMTLLKGSVIDFATELIGSSFRIVENPQAKGSGCGCGVSWELKL